MTPGDSAAATVFVRTTPEHAFHVFTARINTWWRVGARFRIGGRSPGRLALEPSVGGRLTEHVEHSAGEKTYEVGRVLSFEPAERLLLEWRGVNYKPGESTIVEVTFKACGEGTLVRVEHTGFDALDQDHPARHGLPTHQFLADVGSFWGDLLTSFRMTAYPTDSV